MVFFIDVEILEGQEKEHPFIVTVSKVMRRSLTIRIHSLQLSVAMVRLVSHDNIIFKRPMSIFVFTNWHGYHGNLVSIVTDMTTVPNVVCIYS